MGSYLGLVTQDEATRTAFRERLRLLQGGRPGLHIVLDTRGILLAIDAIDQRHLPDGRGIVLGRLHPRDGKRVFADGMTLPDRTIYYSRGRALIDGYWGGYVAVLAAPDGGTDIVKAPLGDLPCYLFRHDDATFFSSHPRLLAACQDRPVTIDWPALTRHLAFGTIRLRETCLGGVVDLAGGERVMIAGNRQSWDTLWSPWSCTRSDRRILDARDAAARLRETTDFVVRTSVADRRCLLKLSGGLDSSILAASLCSGRAALSALTLVTDDPSGDERDYANIVADHLGIPLRAVRRDPAEIDIMKGPAYQLPRPSVPGFRQLSDRLTATAADGCGATVVIDGGGGDNVFCSLQSAAPVADCLLAPEGRRYALTTARSVAAIANVSTLAVLGQATRRALARQRDQRWPVDRQFLTDAAQAGLPDAPPHPWLAAPPATLPGRAAHVALVTGGQSYVEGLDPDQFPPLLVPLLAQPLVELCLRVPSWLWFCSGHNRAAARRAFATELPPAIVGRRSKGSPNAFVAQTAETYRSAIRDLLLEGMLVQQGIADRDSIAQILTDAQPIDDRYLHRIMGLLDAEIWARSWA